MNVIMINSIKNWFWRSETIAWARFQLAFGVIWTVLSVSDLSPLLNPQLMTYWLILSGIITEALRRRGAIKQTVMVPEPIGDGTVQPVPKSYLASPPPGP